MIAAILLFGLAAQAAPISTEEAQSPSSDPPVAAWLDAWEQGDFSGEAEVTAFARLRGHLGAEEARRIVGMLEDPEVARRGELLELLLQVPFEQARPILVAFALEETRPAGERGRVAEFLLLRDGPAAFEDLKTTFRVEEQPPYLRRFFAGWRESIRPQDLPLLERFAKEAPPESESAVGQYALQLWAANETDPEARRRIYLLARDASTSYRSTAMEMLGRRGKDPVIAAMLLEELDGASPDLRRLARRMLPVFAGPEALLEAYRQRAQGQSVNLRGRWMVELAALSLPEAQQEAMQWLVDGGWGSGTLANQVVILLARSAEVDSLLPALLNHGEIPERVLFPLALARAPFHRDAHAYLLEQFPFGGSVLQMKILRSIAARGQDADLRFVREVFESNAYTSAARALAAEILVRMPAAREYVEARFDQPLPEEYELAAAWVRALAASPLPAWQEEAVAAANRADGFEDGEERRGLRNEVWSAFGRHAQRTALPTLTARLWQLLREPEATTEAGVAWPTLARLGTNYPELTVVVSALNRCVDPQRSGVLDLPQDLQLQDLDATPLLVAASMLAKAYPEEVGPWLQELQQRELSQLDHLRVLAMTAHRLTGTAVKREALRALLEDPDALQEYRYQLVEALVPEGAGWVMMAERLGERLLVEEVLAGERPVTDLQRLLHGYAEDDVLRRAANLAEEAGRFELALACAKRRTDHAPLSDAAHAHYALLLGDLEREDEAREAWSVVLRVAPDRSDLWRQAQEVLGPQSD